MFSFILYYYKVSTTKCIISIHPFNRLFERGAANVGLDFLSHLFWDKFVEFEKSMQDYVRVMKILDRIIRIPIHQYARFFEE